MAKEDFPSADYVIQLALSFFTTKQPEYAKGVLQSYLGIPISVDENNQVQPAQQQADAPQTMDAESEAIADFALEEQADLLVKKQQTDENVRPLNINDLRQAFNDGVDHGLTIAIQHLISIGRPNYYFHTEDIRKLQKRLKGTPNNDITRSSSKISLDKNRG